MATAVLVFGEVRDDIEAAVIEERAILGLVQAGVVKRLAAEISDCLAMRRAAGEHQGGIRRGVFSENGKHPALILRAEMEIAVPCENAAKRPAQRQRPHVRDDPLLAWKMALADVDERRRGVHARDIVTRFDEITGDGLAGAASNVHNGRT